MKRTLVQFDDATYREVRQRAFRQRRSSGIREVGRSKRRHVSLVDHISFLVMKRRGVKVAFASDPDFSAAGFTLFGT